MRLCIRSHWCKKLFTARPPIVCLHHPTYLLGVCYERRKEKKKKKEKGMRWGGQQICQPYVINKLIFKTSPHPPSVCVWCFTNWANRIYKDQSCVYTCKVTQPKTQSTVKCQVAKRMTPVTQICKHVVLPIDCRRTVLRTTNKASTTCPVFVWFLVVSIKGRGAQHTIREGGNQFPYDSQRLVQRTFNKKQKFIPIIKHSVILPS